MNLKEAFRFQNKLQTLMDEARTILSQNQNLTRVQNTYLRSKAMAGADDETTMEAPATDYSRQITQIAAFLMHLFAERERLSKAICAAKGRLAIDMDSEVSLNAKRQEIARTFRQMTELRSSEVMLRNGGKGYCFNAEGNQVSYYCDVRRVTTINFDRNKVRAMATALTRKADETSAELDRCLVNSRVDYDAPFDVNDSFADVFGIFADGQGAE